MAKKSTKKTEEKVSEEETPDLKAEFAALGQAMRNALSSTFGSEQRQAMREELRSGIEQVADEINEAAKSIRDSDLGQRVEGKVKQTQDDVRSGRMADDMRGAVAKALRATSEAIDDVATSFRPIEVDKDKGKDKDE